jgi:hypothetical protein
VKSRWLLPCALLVCTSPVALPQRHSNWPTPPEPADKSLTMPSKAPVTRRQQLDQAAIEREARELLELSQSLQPDIKDVTRGMLPEETIPKLKRIEKLSKALRKELGY